MIRNIRHKALRHYWTKGHAKGLSAQQIPRISRILRALEVAETPEEMNLPGYNFHGLSGNRTGRYAIRVTGNYRITFGWDNQDAIDIDLEDYH